MPVWLVGGLVVVVLIQAALLAISWRTNSEIATLRDDVADLAVSAATPAPQIEDASNPGTDGASSPASDPAPAAGGNLPRFLGGGADSALGRNVGELVGLEYYSGENTVFAPDDGVARAIMVWAHWCPYCQEELPLMTQWQNENGDALEGFEIVSVTTAMDDTAANPLVPYLDSSQFPFPVLVDEDGRLARQLGVNAFPFWVFTAPDGTVVGRAAGAIQLGDLDAVFQQLSELEPVADGE
jgi:thiol-disulfide isomerase/thioredoxin